MSKAEILQGCRLAAGCILSVSFFLHVLSLFLLRRVKRGLTNQRLLLINLSITEIVFIPAGIFYYVPIPGKTPGTLMYDLATLGFTVFALNCYMANAFMIADRAFAGIMALRYRSLFTARRVKIVAVLLWLPFLVSPFIYAFGGLDMHVKAMMILVMFLDLVMLIMAFAGYSYVCLAIKRRKKTFKWDRTNANLARLANRQHTKVFKVATPIIATFFIFVVVPDILSITFGILKIDPVYYRRLFYTFPSIDVLVDPVLFLYQYPPLRHEVLRLFRSANDSRDSALNSARSAKSARSVGLTKTKSSSRAGSAASIPSTMTNKNSTSGVAAVNPYLVAKQDIVFVSNSSRLNHCYDTDSLGDECVGTAISPVDSKRQKSMPLPRSFHPQSPGREVVDSSQTEAICISFERSLKALDLMEQGIVSNGRVHSEERVSSLEDTVGEEETSERGQSKVQASPDVIRSKDEQKRSAMNGTSPLINVNREMKNNCGLVLSHGKDDSKSYELFPKDTQSTVVNVQAGSSQQQGPGSVTVSQQEECILVSDRSKCDPIKCDQIKCDHIKCDQINCDQVKCDQINCDQVKM